MSESTVSHEPTVSLIPTPDGITWHTEHWGTSLNHLLLIPSGESNYANFATVARLLASAFTVTTFDMPGMSRTTCPPSAFASITGAKLASQLILLMDALAIPTTTVFGCSSGAVASLALAAKHPNRITSAIIHEAPFVRADSFAAMKALDDDDEIVRVVSHLFATTMCEDETKWLALGAEYHARLERNYVTWVRHYIFQIEGRFTKEELTRRPVTWTIGALTPAGRFWQNLVDGFGAGIAVGLLPCQHFPQVTIPEKLAEHVKGAAERYLK